MSRILNVVPKYYRFPIRVRTAGNFGFNVGVGKSPAALHRDRGPLPIHRSPLNPYVLITE